VRLLEANSIGAPYDPFPTGPGVVKEAMRNFMRNFTNFQQVKAGSYVGIDHQSITVRGTNDTSDLWIERKSVAGIHKIDGYYADMGMMKPFTHAKDKAKPEWCWGQLYKEAVDPDNWL
jgi:hypothetical protein